MRGSSRARSATREALRLRGPSRRQLSRRQREIRWRRAIVLGGTGLIVVIAALLAFGYWRENVARAQETIAVVYGEPITAGDLLPEVRRRSTMLDQQLLNLQSRGLSQQVTQLQFQRQRLPAAALNGLLRERVTRREAAQRGIVVSPAEIDERLRQQIAEYGAALLPRPTSTPTATPRPDRAPTEATPSLEPTATPVPTLTEERFGPALQAYLQQQQYTEEQLRRAIESDLYAEKLRKSIGLEVPAVQEQVQARHIVSRTEEAARTLLDRLGAGEPFAVLAASDSEDKATGDKGGELGWLFRRERDPDFEAVVFALQPGETSPVVQTAAGWEIVQVLERDPARPIDEQQLEALSDSRYSEWLSNALSTPEVERRLTQEQTDWVLRQVSGRRPG